MKEYLKVSVTFSFLDEEFTTMMIMMDEEDG